jgi:phosphoadenosine phosphosulfate reductase
MKNERVYQLLPLFKEISAEEALKRAREVFGGKLAFASSFGLEDQVITDMISRKNLDIPIFTLDTGRLFNETYELIEKTEKHYGIKISMYHPESGDLESMLNNSGVNLFYESIEKRRLCCQVRKLKPLKRALFGLSAWICGLRREQSVTREKLETIEWDELNGLIKINPLTDWSYKDLEKYIIENEVPYNPLHDRGFVSIGCACCTRAIKPGEDPRAGRWWWEEPEHKECGLHLANGHVERKSKT